MGCVERQKNTLDLLWLLSPHVIQLWSPLWSIRFPPLLSLVVSVNGSVYHLDVRSPADQAHLSWGLNRVGRDALVQTSDPSTDLWPLVLVGKLLLTRFILYFILRKPWRELSVWRIPVDQQFGSCSCLQPSTESTEFTFTLQSFWAAIVGPVEWCRYLLRLFAGLFWTTVTVDGY